MLAGLFVAGFAAFAAPLRTPPVVFLRSGLLVQCNFRCKFPGGQHVTIAEAGIRQNPVGGAPLAIDLWPDATHALPAEVADEVIREFVIEHR